MGGRREEMSQNCVPPLPQSEIEGAAPRAGRPPAPRGPFEHRLDHVLRPRVDLRVQEAVLTDGLVDALLYERGHLVLADELVLLKAVVLIVVHGGRSAAPRGVARPRRAGARALPRAFEAEKEPASTAQAGAQRGARRYNTARERERRETTETRGPGGGS